MSEGSEENAYERRTTSTDRRALSEILPELVAAAACKFLTGPLLTDPYRIDDKAGVVTVVELYQGGAPSAD